MPAVLAPPQPTSTQLLVPKKRTRTRPKAQKFPKPVSTKHEQSAADAWRNGLPTLPWEDGYRLVTDPTTGETIEVPLTLFDVLYECEEDIGAVFMMQGPSHALVTRVLAVMLQAYLAAKGWFILNDVSINWGFPGFRPKAPDVAAFLGGRMPPEKKKSYRVGRDGPIPAFVIEVTSERTREADLITKKAFYASMGVQEYLIIDMLPEKGKDWKLIGYRLQGEPEYTKITPDDEEGIRFENVGLRFVAVDHTRVDVFDLTTGERLLTTEELKSIAAVETARANAEAKARAEAEAKSEERDRQIIRAMRENGVAPSTIAKFLTLPMDKVEAILQEQAIP